MPVVLVRLKHPLSNIDTQTSTRNGSSNVQNVDDLKLYERIIQFVCNQVNCNTDELQPGTSFYHDLGVDGIDGEDLISSFQREFDVDMSCFQYDLHFGPEFGFVPIVWLYWRIFMPDKLNEKGARKMVPITVIDLYQAARTRVWPSMQNRARQ